MLFRSYTMHKHDIRAYETLKVRMLPLKQISIHVEGTDTVQIHGMGTLWQAEDQDEYSVLASNSELIEEINIPLNTKDAFVKTTTALIGTTTLWTPTTDYTQVLYKLHIYTHGQQDAEIYFTDSAGNNPRYIGQYFFGGSGGVYTIDFDQTGLSNPHGANGLLKVTTANNTSTNFYVIGSNKLSGT